MRLPQAASIVRFCTRLLCTGAGALAVQGQVAELAQGRPWQRPPQMIDIREGVQIDLRPYESHRGHTALTDFRLRPSDFSGR